MTQTKTHTNEKETKMTTSPIRMQQRPMEEDMNPNRRTAVLVGALFLISTATFILSNALMTPLLSSHDFLAAVAEHSQRMIAATLMGLIEGVATVGIAVALYPILIRQHPALAPGYAGMRIAGLAIAAVGFGPGGGLLGTPRGTTPHRADTWTRRRPGG